MYRKRHSVSYKILMLMLAAVLVLSLLPVTARAESSATESVDTQSEGVSASAESGEGETPAEELPGGTCGEGLTWQLQEGVLTITCEAESGVIASYALAAEGEGTTAPWNEYRDTITEIQLDAAGQISIGDFAFASLTSLTSVQLGETTRLGTIGESAFRGCTSLATINLGSATSIGESAFQGCTSLAAIDLSSATAIGKNVFQGCSALTSLQNAGSIATIGEHAFDGCTSLTNLNAFTGLTRIAANAFSGSGLKHVTIPDGVTSLNSYAFSGCSELIDIDLNRVTEIGSFAFRNCIRLESADLKNTVKNIAMFAFSGCSKLHQLSNMEAVSSMAGYAFYGCKGLTEFTVPSAIQELNDNTFGYCTGLTKVYIPRSVYISSAYSPDNPFEDCAETLVLFTEDTYSGSDWLDGMHVSAGVSPEEYALCKPNEAVTEVDLSVFTRKIPDYAFYHCSQLEAVEVPDTVKEIGEYAFDGCSKLEALTVPDNVERIGKYAFNGCESLTAFTVPSAVEELQESTFGGCTGLTKVYLPGTVKISETESPLNPFEGCAETLVLFTEETYSGSDWLNTMHVSAGISAEVYALCKPNEEVLSADLSVFQDVPDYAFYGCTGLDEITVPSTVRSIGRYAFHSCKDLVKALFRTSACTMKEKAFGNNAEGFTVHGISGTDYRAYCREEDIPFLPIESCRKHTADMLEKVEEKVATCTEPGNKAYWVCTQCGSYFADENAETSLSAKPLISRKSHTKGEPVRENEIPATCIAEGSYEEVICCTECGVELSRTPKVIEKTDHTPAEAVKEHEVAPTEEARGHYEEVVYCSICHEELSRTLVETKLPTTITLSDKTVTYNGKAQTVGKAAVTGSSAVTYAYYTNAACTNAVAESQVKNAGTYYVKAEAAEDEFHAAAVSTAAKLIINKAKTTITLSGKTAKYTGKAITIGKATAKGSSKKITYIYYTDKNCTKKTTKKNSGASGTGKAPAYIGTYYVVASVKADANYKAASKTVKLVIQPKVTFKYVTLYKTHPEYRYSGYPDRDYLYPTISLTGVKYYKVELYNSKGKRINKDYTKKYTKKMEYGTKPSSAEFKKGQKYQMKVIIVPKKGRSVTVTSKWLKFKG